MCSTRQHGVVPEIAMSQTLWSTLWLPHQLAVQLREKLTFLTFKFLSLNSILTYLRPQHTCGPLYFSLTAFLCLLFLLFHHVLTSVCSPSSSWLFIQYCAAYWMWTGPGLQVVHRMSSRDDLVQWLCPMFSLIWKYIYSVLLSLLCLDQEKISLHAINYIIYDISEETQ